MSDTPLKLLLVDPDPIFRLGLRVALEEFTELQVVSEAETYTTALQILAELARQNASGVNLVIVELGNSHSTSSQQIGLQLCQQLKTQYPNLSVLLLSSVQDHGLLLAARAAGVDGYCPKGTPIAELVSIIQEVAVGRSYWFQDKVEGEEREEAGKSQKLPSRPLTRLRNRLRVSGTDYINTTLMKVTAQLQAPGLPLFEGAILAGKRRELLVARWFLNRILSSPNPSKPDIESRKNTSLTILPAVSSSLSTSLPHSLVSPKAIQAALFASCVQKLQFDLKNLTNIPLEIDILRLEKKRELLYIILQKITDILNEVSNSQLDIQQLYEIKKDILIDVWRGATTDFFGKFSRLNVNKTQVGIASFLLQDTEVVQPEILNKIPLTHELFSYLVFEKDLHIDNSLYSAHSLEAQEQGLMILENLLIQIANAVIQPLLNKLANVEEIKQNFYKRQMISTREVERFRNNLSWKYRFRNYITEPKAIFESRYDLFVLVPRGIATVSIYAPRSQELAELTGISLVVTFVLEFADAIAPRLQSLFSLLGSGVVFILTQVVGRGLGLIGRGILQGLGSVSLSDKRNKHF